MPVTYGQALVVLVLAIVVFIGALILWRRRFPGDYTVFKVIFGMGLVLLAQLYAGRLHNWSWEQLWLVVGVPLCIGGALISMWQLLEWIARRWEQVVSRVNETQRRFRRR